MSISISGRFPASSRGITRALPGPTAFGLAIGSAIFAAVLWLPVVLSDPDTLWHITVGQWILSHAAVPSTDIYSFTAEGRPWVAHEWLSEVLLAVAYRSGGWTGVMILTAAAAGCTGGIVAAQVRRFLRLDAALMIVLLAIACAGGSLLARPHLLALPCLALWTAVVVSARDRGRTPPLVLLPLLTVWANLHGGFVVGIALAWALGFEAVCDASCDRRRQLRGWGVFAAGAVLAAMITPHGIDGLLFPFRLLAMKNLYLIQEWTPSELGRLNGLSVAILLAVYLGLTARIALPKLRVAMLAGLLFTAMRHSRNGQVFAVVAPLLLSGCLGRVVAAGWPGRFIRSERIAGLAVLLAAVVSLSVRLGFATERNDALYYASAALDHVPAALRARPVLNEYGFGGLLIFSGIRPFIDGRADLYGDDGLGNYLDIIQARGNALESALCRYDIAWTMFTPDSIVAILMDRSSGWHRLYSDKLAVIHVRDSDYRPLSCRDR